MKLHSWPEGFIIKPPTWAPVNNITSRADADRTVDRRTFSPIFKSAWIFSDGREISATTAPRTLYTVKKKNQKSFSTYFVIEVLRYLSNFDLKIRFFVLIFKICRGHFCFLYFRNLTRDCCLIIWEEKKVENMILKFFQQCIFTFFSRCSSHFLPYLVSIRDIWII